MKEKFVNEAMFCTNIDINIFNYYRPITKL